MKNNNNILILLLALFFTISFQAQNTLPTFTSSAIISVNENTTYTYTITTADGDNDLLSLTAPIAPSWLSLAITNINVSTLAGSTAGFLDGLGTVAQFEEPSAIVVDAAGNIYVADAANNSIRKITPNGVVTTLAGSLTAGNLDATGVAAQFNGPAGIAIDAAGNIYIADQFNHRIRKITPAGVVTTFAGSTSGFANDTGTAAQFNNPIGVAVDASGNVYVADSGNHKIRKITPTGVVTTFAGSTSGFTNATGTAAQFNTPTGVAVDALGTVYVADQNNHLIRKITATGVVTTLAGSVLGSNNGTGTTAQFNFPRSVAVNSVGIVYVADEFNSIIRKITPTGVVTTFAGSSQGFLDASGSTAQFDFPFDVAVDVAGTVYVADRNNNKIRKITADDILTGNTTGKVGTHPVVLNVNDGNGGSTNQSFTITVNDVTAPIINVLAPEDDDFDITIGSNFEITFNENVQKGTGNILIVDASNDNTVQTIAVLSAQVSINSTVVTINPTSNLEANKSYYIKIDNTAFTDTSSNAFMGILDGTTWNFDTLLNTPPTFTSTAVLTVDDNATYTYNFTTNDTDGNIVVISATTLPSWLSIATQSTDVTTLAGSTAGFNDGAGATAQFNFPADIVIDALGNIFVVDEGNHKIRMISSSGFVSTFAGSTQGYVDGISTFTKFNAPTGIAIDVSGTIYVADTGNHKIRKITPFGVVTTFAGSTAGFNDGVGPSAQFTNPSDIAIDTFGNVYVADTGNHKIRKITPDGVVSTLAGTILGSDDGTGLAAQFNAPSGIVVDGAGILYVADENNHRIRKITAAGVVTTLAGSSSGFLDATGTAAQFNFPKNIAVDAAGTVYVADLFNHKIRKITAAGVVTTLAGTSQGFNDDVASAAQFNLPIGVAADAAGSVYVADRSNNKIRKITENKVLTGDATGQSGTHDVVLNANDGNGGSTNQNFTITINSTLGIDANLIKGFVLYPNPVRDILNFSAQEQIKKIQVFNLIGQLVAQKQVNNTKTSIDLSHLTQGTYFVKVTTNTASKAVKLIKK